jgi:hypothetical protein
VKLPLRLSMQLCLLLFVIFHFQVCRCPALCSRQMAAVSGAGWVVSYNWAGRRLRLWPLRVSKPDACHILPSNLHRQAIISTRPLPLKCGHQ